MAGKYGVLNIRDLISIEIHGTDNVMKVDRVASYVLTVVECWKECKAVISDLYINAKL